MPQTRWGNVLRVDRLEDDNPSITPKGHVRRAGESDVYSDADTPAHGRSGSVFVQGSSPSDAAPLSYGAKVLVWISLISASWAAVILVGYIVWSAL
jgi:hypothetical protein